MAEAPDFYGLRVQKWTKAERDHAMALRDAHGYGPKKLSTLTGIPQGQIKFWLSSARWAAKRKGKAAAADSYRMKFQDWESWRAASLRSTFVQLAKINPVDGVLPTRDEIEAWLRSVEKTCFYCQVALTPKNFSVDHRVATCRGGASQFDNLVATCRRCNTAKSVLDEAEFRQLLSLVAGWSEMSRRSVMARLGRGFVGRRFSAT